MQTKFALVRKMRVELTRYFYHRYLKPARLPFRHFRIFNFGLYFVKTQAVVFAQVSEPSASLAPKIFYFWRAPSHYHPKNIFIFGEPQFRHFRIFNFGLNFVKAQTFVFAPSLKNSVDTKFVAVYFILIFFLPLVNAK